MKTKTLSVYWRLLRYAYPYRRRLIIGVLAGFISGGSLFGVVQFVPNLVRALQGGAEEQELGRLGSWARDSGFLDRIPESGSLQFLVLSVIALIFFYFLKAFFTFLNRYLMRWVGGRVIVDLRNELFSCLQAQSLVFYATSDVGNLIARCVNDTAQVERAVATSIADLSRAPVELVALTAAVVYASINQEIYFLAIAIFVVMPLCIVPIIILGRKVRMYSRKSMEQISNLVGRMHENFTGIRVVKAFHTEKREEERFQYINNRYFKQVIRALRAELFMTPLTEFVTVILLCGFFIYCYQHGISLADVTPLILAAVLAYDPVKRLARVNTYIQRSMASAERIFQILDTDTSLPEPADPTKIDAFKDRIVYDNVGFHYNTEEGDGWAIRNIDLEIRRGEVVALVGGTGSGKSTLANLLARFYDVTSGSVTIDGIDVRQLEIASLRRLISVVTQDTILFNDTIAHNIAYGSEWATQADIEAAARRANAHDFIVAEKGGYERVVGEKGFTLSGGQKQRIAIARAILRNSQILILDEATSALDTATERQVQEALNNLMQDRTVVAIAHRLSTIRHADQIVVLDNGRIIERGTHQELLDHEGIYKDLIEMDRRG